MVEDGHVMCETLRQVTLVDNSLERVNIYSILGN